MNTKKQIGVVLLVAALVAGIWSYGRYSNIMGQMCTWSPPFNGYEILTIVGALLALVCLLVGLRIVNAKEPEKPKS